MPTCSRYESVSGDSGQSYCIAAGFEANLLVENNYFDGSNNPLRFQTGGDTSAQVTERGNEFVSTSGSVVTRGSAFVPPYDYTMDSGASVKDLVTQGAGPE
jgi:pectate lyase